MNVVQQVVDTLKTNIEALSDVRNTDSIHELFELLWLPLSVH